MQVPVRITHHADQGKFIAQVRGVEAYLEYGRPDTSTLEINATYVPDALKGQGVAGQIVTQLIRYAADEHLKVKPACPYAISYFENNPQYKTHLA